MSGNWPGVEIDLAQNAAQPVGAPRPIFTVPNSGGEAKERRDDAGAYRDQTRTDIAVRGEDRDIDMQAFKKASELRDAYSGNHLVKAYETSVPMFVAALKTDPTREGDLLFITAFAKLSDPTTGVLGGEREGVPRDAQSYIENKQAELRSVLDAEGGKFNDDTRENLRRQLLQLMAQRGNAYKQQRERFIADAEAYGLDPARVVGPNVADPERSYVVDYFGKGKARAPDMRAGVPSGSEVRFGMDAPLDGPEGGFNRNDWLKGMGLDPDEEAEIVAFWNENRGNKDLTVGAAKKWFQDRGYGLPTDEDIALAVRDARKGATFTAMDSSAAKAAYEAKLDDENKRRGFDPGGVEAGVGQLNQGGTLTLSDEITGALGGIGAALQGENPVDAYTFNRDLERRQLEQSSQAHPYESGFLNLTGSLVAPVGMVGKGAKAAEYVKAGAKTGAVAGFGQGEGLADSAAGAVAGTILGAGAGKLIGKGSEWLAARKVARGERVTQPGPNLPRSGGVETGAAIPPAPLSPAEQTEIATLAKKATGWGPSARTARKELARKAAANPEAKAAAERLGVDLPPDILSDDAQLQSLIGLTRSEVGSEAETGWRGTTANVASQADQALADLGASPDLAQLSDDVLNRLNGAAESLQRQAKALREEVDAAVSPGGRVAASRLEEVVAKLIDDYGGLAEAKAAMTAQEKSLLTMLGEGKEAVRPTYARLNRLRDDIGEALNKNQGPWADVNRKQLGDYYRALADDQLAAVEQMGGAELADKQRAANALFSRMYDQRGEMQELFGKNLEKGLAPLIKRALTAGSKGDAKDLTLLLDRVPEDVRGGAVTSSIMALSRSSASHGGFSFANYAKLYRGLRENGPVYAKIATAVGPGAERVLRDLYEISNRMAAGETKVLKTGKANQALASAMNAESLVSSILSAAGGRAGVAAGSAAGGAVAGPVGAAAGATMANATRQAIGGAGNSRLDKVHGLLTSPEFRATIDRIAAGDSPEAAGEALWNSVAFHKFAKSVGAASAASRRALLKSMIAGASEKASGAIEVNLSAAPTRMAAGERRRSEDEDSATKAEAGQ